MAHTALVSIAAARAPITVEWRSGISNSGLKLRMTMKARTWILIVSACLCGSISSIAQDQTVTPPNQDLRKEYVSPDRRFKVRFPDEPKEIDFPFDTKTGQLVIHTLMHTSTINYWFSYINFPINFEKANAIKATLDRGAMAVWRAWQKKTHAYCRNLISRLMVIQVGRFVWS